ncbi:MAG: hypothetical protein Q9183_003518, partial [Haloplaca sp. 2 TL-2023]
HGALAVPEGREIATTINRLLDLPFTVRIATRDWHPPDHISFAASHPPPNNKAFVCSARIADPQDPSGTTGIPLWPVHCVQDTPGAEIIPEIDVSKIDRIIDKGRDKHMEMFSAFADIFWNKSDAASFDLGAFLKEIGVVRIFVVGLAGDYCVRCTAIDGLKEGFEVYVVEEGVKSIDEGPKGWGKVKAELQQLGARIISIDGSEVRDIQTKP